MTQFLRPLVAIALYALLLPVAGPLLDHHYAEWQHNHAHVYFGNGPEGSQGYHLHIYDWQGSHGHLPTSETDDGNAPGGLAYFTNQDGSANGMVYSPVGPTLETPCYPDPDDCPLLTQFDAAETRPPGTRPAPPLRPPTA